MTINKGIKLNSYIEIDEQVIKVRAYYYWENAGRPDGRSDEFYFQALNDIFDETEVAIIETSKPSEDDVASWSFEIATESDSNWFKDIEETMPEIKHMRFKDVSAKLSWLFNNLKKFKRNNPEDNPCEETPLTKPVPCVLVAPPEYVDTVIETAPEPEESQITCEEKVEEQISASSATVEAAQASIESHLGKVPIPDSKLSEDSFREMYKTDKLSSLQPA